MDTETSQIFQPERTSHSIVKIFESVADSEFVGCVR